MQRNRRYGLGVRRLLSVLLLSLSFMDVGCQALTMLPQLMGALGPVMGAMTPGAASAATRGSGSTLRSPTASRGSLVSSRSTGDSTLSTPRVVGDTVKAPPEGGLECLGTPITGGSGPKLPPEVVKDATLEFRLAVPGDPCK